MSVEGVRVVRGPNWSHGNDDGGEGHVGTVTQDNEDDTVEVQWDMGNSGTYNIGSKGQFELYILESSPAGLKHGGVKCDACSASEFPGTRWKCSSCKDFDLCTLCYFKDKHDTSHPFERLDAPGLKGVSVPKRSRSSRQRALGIYSGANVKRGADWNSGNQDGGDGKIGKVTETKNYGTGGGQRDAVKVTWPNKEANTYRVGYRGKVDLECVEEAPGTDYYRDHLFALSTATVPKVSIRQRPVSAAPKPRGDKKPNLQIGDKVCVDLPEMALKEAQRGHGGWSMRMKDYIGKSGVIKRFEDNGDCVINYDGKEWSFNAQAVTKISTSLKVGDIVRVMSVQEKVEALQKRHGGWNADMQVVLGKVGKIVKIDSDGDIAVAFGSRAYVLNPACLTPAPGEKVFQLSEGSGDGGRDKPSGGAGKDDDDDSGDENAELLGRLIAQMFLLHGQGEPATSSSQELIAAAANNNTGAVTAILKKQPALINEKFKGLTALIISSHEGHVGVVKILLQGKANLDLTEEKGNTALMAALMKKREEAAKMLLAAGANANLVNQQGRTALHFAAANGANDTLREMLKLGVDLNKTDIAGDTPIHDAIHNKNSSGVAFLVADSKINLTLCNKKGLSPLHLAAIKDDELAVSRIITKAPNLLNATPSDGNTALHVAAVNDNTDVVKTLIKAKADVNRQNAKKYTPLHLACHKGHVKTVELLVNNDAKLNIQDEDGDTALHNTVAGSNSDRQSQQLAMLLLGMRVTDEREVTDRTNMACFLIQHGARHDIKNNKGRTPLECCSNPKMRDAIKMFAAKHAPKPSPGGATRGGADVLQLLAGLLPLPCALCREKMADCKLMPCGHKVLCQHCSFRVRECPICDKAIQERYDFEGRRLVLNEPCKVQ